MIKYFWIAVGIAILHRLLVYGIAILAFGLGMSAFSGGSGAHLADPLMMFARLLDFPIMIFSFLAFRVARGHFPSEGLFGIYNMTLPAPFIWMIAWSLCVGSFFSFLLYRRHVAKYGVPPHSFWKSGL